MKAALIQELKDAFNASGQMDPKATELINNLEAVVNSILFFKKDKEMKIKYPDIYKMQVEGEEKKFDAIKNSLIELGSRNNIDIEAIFDKQRDAAQELEDFFKDE
ncbi:MAG: hypothetical protein CL663_02770 [Bacteroidetes bacterium]|nr:hypothetical protein [Bacteroidota bacterium]|tara:strand:+ start:122 stop:436 length:315 start_codon:yes stop_codon:yes gene_type:complete